MGSLALERKEEAAAEIMLGRGLAEPLQPAAPGPTSLESLVAPLGIQSQQFSRRAEVNRVGVGVGVGLGAAGEAVAAGWWPGGRGRGRNLF